MITKMKQDERLDINLLDNTGMNALHYAAKFNPTRTVATLVEECDAGKFCTVCNRMSNKYHIHFLHLYILYFAFSGQQ